MIDLTGKNKIQHDYVVDEQTGEVTITLTDYAPLTPVVLGEVKIEAGRLRAFVDAMSLVTHEIFGDLTSGLQKCKTVFDKQQNAAKTEF